jgi:hypothetical protein
LPGSPLVDCLTAQIQDTTIRKSTGQPSNVWNQTINARNEENGGACLDALSRAIMDYDALNTGVRKFFRKVRVTAQREIEKAVRDADAKRKQISTTLPTRAVVTVGGIDVKFDVDGDIELA